ncbi:MAG: uncharacterized protein A8A55_2368, partial [Amphiamblys sp. WSBS2006]
ENNSIWVGKVKLLKLEWYAVGILLKLRMHEKNVMEELWLNAYEVDQITEILKTENKSVWVGKVRKISLEGHAGEIKGKLDFTLIAPDGQEETGSD